MWKGRGAATAKGFAFVQLGTLVGKSQPFLFPKNWGFWKKGSSAEKVPIKRRVKMTSGEKRVAVDKRSSSEGVAGDIRRFLVMKD